MTRSALTELPLTELGADEPRFAEPWQAHAFALGVALGEAGVFTPAEWSESLGAELRAGEVEGEAGGEAGGDYYAAWLAAVERLAIARGLVDAPALARRKAAWARAYRTTAHGKPVTLSAGEPRPTRTSAAPGKFSSNHG